MAVGKFMHCFDNALSQSRKECPLGKSNNVLDNLTHLTVTFSHILTTISTIVTYNMTYTQVEYYATHQCFLTNRSLFLLVWNIEDGEEGLLSLRFWLENIEVRHTLTTILFHSLSLSLLCTKMLPLSAGTGKRFPSDCSSYPC